MDESPQERADRLYALLRVTGEVTVFAHEKSLLSALRSRAKKDGLNTVQAAIRNTQRWVTRRTVVNLVDPADPKYIVRPDADKEA